MVSIRRALLSVSDKTGVVELAQALAARGVELLSTGGTAKLLSDAGLKVTEVSAHTGFPEIMAGRVKTLHPKVHGGLLGRRGVDEGVMAEHGIAPIDLLVLNLYPFEATVARPECTHDEAIENIDIGGPAMLRAAAKNYAGVAVLTDPAQYADFLRELEEHGGVSDALRFSLARAAFDRVARYDAAISDYLSSLDAEGQRQAFPGQLNLGFQKVMDLRYGENPHQHAAFYQDFDAPAGSLATFRQLAGKALSFNNIADADAAWECVRQFREPACVVVKHANPCGVAQGGNLENCYERAYTTDPTSAFGGIIAFNRELDAPLVELILARQFVEVLIAPKVTAAARAACATKPNVRLLEIPAGDGAVAFDLKRVGGGLLVQTPDLGTIGADDVTVVTQRVPTPTELADLLFARKVAKFVKSNAIVYAKGGMTVGVGAGQMSRVYSARIAAIKAADAHLEVKGSVMASDAFFPFRDGIDMAAEVGVTAVIQPGGSVKDREVIAAADEHGMAMVFTGMRHFRH